jgi:hypothetical protein
MSGNARALARAIWLRQIVLKHFDSAAPATVLTAHVDLADGAFARIDLRWSRRTPDGCS